MEWDKPVKDVSPSSASQAAANGRPDAHANKADPGLPQAGQPVWSDDIRAYYQAAAEEPIPQDFVDLMARIADQIKK